MLMRVKWLPLNAPVKKDRALDSELVAMSLSNSSTGRSVPSWLSFDTEGLVYVDEELLPSWTGRKQ